MQYRNQNTERSPRLPRKHLFRAEHAAVYCSVLAVGVAVGIYFALQPYVGTEEIGLDVHLGRRTLCRLRVLHLPRHDRRTGALDVVQI